MSFRSAALWLKAVCSTMWNLCFLKKRENVKNGVRVEFHFKDGKTAMETHNV
jgi:hypothetical protein